MHITVLNIGAGHCALHAWMARLAIDASGFPTLQLGQFDAGVFKAITEQVIVWGSQHNLQRLFSFAAPNALLCGHSTCFLNPCLQENVNFFWTSFMIILQDCKVFLILVVWFQKSHILAITGQLQGFYQSECCAVFLLLRSESVLTFDSFPSGCDQCAAGGYHGNGQRDSEDHTPLFLCTMAPLQWQVMRKYSPLCRSDIPLDGQTKMAS